MLNFRGVIEVDEDQVRTGVVTAGVDDRRRADAVEKRSGEFGAFVDMPVQREARLVFLNPTAHCFAADVSAIEKHIALRTERRRVNNRYRVCGVFNWESLELLRDTGEGIEIGLKVLDQLETARRPLSTAVGNRHWNRSPGRHPSVRSPLVETAWAARPLRVFQSGTTAAYCFGNSLDRFLLVDQSFVNPVFHVEQFFGFTLQHLRDRNSGPTGNQLRDLFFGNLTANFFFLQPLFLALLYSSSAEKFRSELSCLLI